jgi:hypothetical protein
MKAIVLLSAVVLAVAMPAMADAALAGGCAQVVQSVNSLAGTIAGGASSYWAHRENFVELTYGESRQTVPNALQLAAQAKSQADSLKRPLSRHWRYAPGSITSRLPRGAAIIDHGAEPRHRAAARINGTAAVPRTS